MDPKDHAGVNISSPDEEYSYPSSGEDDDDDDEEDDGEVDRVDEAPPELEEHGPRTRRDVNGPRRDGRTRFSCWPPPPSPQRPHNPVWSPLFHVRPGSFPTTTSSSAGGAQADAPRPSRPRPSQPQSWPPAHAPLRPGNPVYGHRMRLYSRTGYYLAILPRGRVIGTSQQNDKHSVLEFSSVSNKEVRIRGVEANLFLAMNRQGKLYGQANVQQEGTVFVEMLTGSYNTYLSRKFAHAAWYVGIKKNGKQKPAHKTAWGQKAVQFLPIRV